MFTVTGKVAQAGASLTVSAGGKSATGSGRLVARWAAAGETLASIAKSYGVHVTMISRL